MTSLGVRIVLIESSHEVESKSLKMPKTVEELVAERQNTGNVVYKESGQMIVPMRDEQSRTFAIKTPVTAIW